MVSRQKKAQRLHMVLFRLQDGLCSICGKRIERYRERSYDHVVPRSWGGFSRGNKLLAHRACNFRKLNAGPTGCELILLAAVNAWMMDDGERRLVELDLARVLAEAAAAGLR